MDSAVAALVGAFIGSSVSVVGMLVQERARAKRELIRTAADIAMRAWEKRAEIMGQYKDPAKLLPVSAGIHYQAEVLRAVANGKFSSEWVVEQSARQLEITKAYMKVDEAYEKASRERKK